MKILVVDENRRVERAEYSGGNKQLDNILRELIHRYNYTADFLPPAISTIFSLKGITQSISRLISSKSQTVNKDYDMVVISSPFPNTFLSGLRVSKQTKLPTVIYFHHFFSPLYMPVKRGLFHSLFIGFIFLITLSLSKIMEFNIFMDNSSFYKLGTTQLIDNQCAIDQDYINRIRASKENDKEIVKNYDLVFVGRFQPHKGSEDLLKVVTRMNLEGNRVKLAVVGKIHPTYFKKVSKYVNKKGIQSSIDFLGWLSEEDKITIMRQSKAFVFLSYEEGWGLSVMEAALLGLPIIAYDLFAYSYLKNNFFKIEIGNVEEARKKIDACLDNYSESIKIAQLAKNEVMKYSYSMIADFQATQFQRICFGESTIK